MSLFSPDTLLSHFSFLTDGNQDPNSAQGDQAAAILVPDIQDTRNMLQSLGVSIPVGNSDAGSYFNNKILAAVDYGVRTLILIRRTRLTDVNLDGKCASMVCGWRDSRCFRRLDGGLLPNAGCGHCKCLA